MSVLTLTSNFDDMVLAVLAFQPEEVNVGVDIFGFSKQVRTLNSSIP